jgi:hypothetical protein
VARQLHMHYQDLQQQPWRQQHHFGAQTAVQLTAQQGCVAQHTLKAVLRWHAMCVGLVGPSADHT